MPKPSEADMDAIDELALTALGHATRNELDDALATVRSISDRYGANGIYGSLITWCDVLAVHFQVPPEGQVMHVAFHNATTGQVGDATEVSPVVAWAGQLINARFARDRDTYEALIDALPNDPKVIGEHVVEVLFGVAYSLTNPQPQPDGEPA